MQLAGFVIRTMSRADLDLAMSWARQEGWNPAPSDADVFYASDPEGFLLGVLDGAPIGCLSVVRYGAQYAFMGFYIVKLEYRGLGYGWALWQAGMAFLAGRSIGLDGVLAQQANYTKSGFVLAYRNIRYMGWRPQVLATPSSQLQPVHSLDIAQLIAYDAQCFGVERSIFLQAWLTAAGTRAWAHVEDGQLCGYGVIRLATEGYKIGPLFADRAEVAQALLSALLADIPASATFYWDIPEPNAAALDLAQQYGLQPVFETARMYAGSTPALPIERIFGVTSFELG